jgi:hypothetical protein
VKAQSCAPSCAQTGQLNASGTVGKREFRSEVIFGRKGFDRVARALAFQIDMEAVPLWNVKRGLIGLSRRRSEEGCRHQSAFDAVRPGMDSRPATAASGLFLGHPHRPGPAFKLFLVGIAAPQWRKAHTRPAVPAWLIDLCRTIRDGEIVTA